MQFRQDRQQDEKDMAFETFGALNKREAFAYIQNDNFSSTKLHDPMALESSRLAEL